MIIKWQSTTAKSKRPPPKDPKRADTAPKRGKGKNRQWQYKCLLNSHNPSDPDRPPSRMLGRVWGRAKTFGMPYERTPRPISCIKKFLFWEIFSVLFDFFGYWRKKQDKSGVFTQLLPYKQLYYYICLLNRGIGRKNRTFWRVEPWNIGGIFCGVMVLAVATHPNQANYFFWVNFGGT